MDDDEKLVKGKERFDPMEVLTKQDRYAQSFSRCSVKGRDKGWGMRRKGGEKRKKKKKKREKEKVIVL